MYIKPRLFFKMKRLFILLSIINYVSARNVGIEIGYQTATDNAILPITKELCSITEGTDGSGPVTGPSNPLNDGVARFETGKCKLLLDEDNQKTTDYDFITPTYFNQPTQLGDWDNYPAGNLLCMYGNIKDVEKCMLYSVKIEDTEDTDQCVKSGGGVVTKICTDNAADDSGDNTCITVTGKSTCEITYTWDGNACIDSNGNTVTVNVNNLEIATAGDNEAKKAACEIENAFTWTGQQKVYSKCEVEIRGLGSTADGSNKHGGSKVTLNYLGSNDIPGTELLYDDHQQQVLTTYLDGNTCRFMPLNHRVLGKVDIVVKFTLENPAQDESKFVYVKMGVNFVPHTEASFGADGKDNPVTMQHDAFMLMQKSNVNNQKDDQCQATDGIDYPGMQRLNNADLTGKKCRRGDMTNDLDDCSAKINLLVGDTDPTELNTRSTGDGCVTTGSTAHLYTEATGGGSLAACASDNPCTKLDEVCNNNVCTQTFASLSGYTTDDTKFNQIDSADGTAVKLRVMGHFIDRRYTIIDQSGVEALLDNIGDFQITTQALNIKADYLRIGTTRQTYASNNVPLKKLNYDDYASTCHMALGNNNADDFDITDNNILTEGYNCPQLSDNDDDGNNYAQYYLDHDHVIAYEHIKHMQESYMKADVACSGACKNALVLKGFNDQVRVKMALDPLRAFPKAPWNIYIPKMDISSHGPASVVKLTSEFSNPNYGLPVLDTQYEPQYSDGYPLSYFFKLNGALSDCSVTGNCDEVDSYDDKYEVFNRLTIKSSNSNIEEYYRSIDDDQTTTPKGIGTKDKCSSNRAKLLQPGAFADGTVKDIGLLYVDANGVPSGYLITMMQEYMDNCRLQINENTYFDQILMSWNNDATSCADCDARMCQADDQTEKADASIPYCTDANDGDYVASSVNRKDTIHMDGDKCINCVKMTVIDRRKVLIGSTELSLLRRQEVFAGQGVQVSGSNIVFLLGKVNGEDNANGKGVLEFDIWGTDAMQGYKHDATQCEEDDLTADDGSAGVCEEEHGCALSDGVFGDAVDGDSADICAEKKVKTPKKDNEYTMHTIRSTTQCNGKLDIQLRLRREGDDDCVDSNCGHRDWDVANLLLDSSPPAAGFLRPTYDVRFPCSRISQQTSDSIHLKYVFGLTYDLQTDEFTATAEGVSSLDGAVEFDTGVWSNELSADQTSGFTKQISFQAHLGTCETTLNSLTSVTAQCSDVFSEDTVGKSILTVTQADCGCGDELCDADSDNTNGIQFDNRVDTSTGEVLSLDEEITVALIYERKFKYVVDRHHRLDTLVDDTSYTDTQYFCEDQKFKVSLNPTKTASVSVITPVQLVMERQAQITGITWETCNADQGTYKMKIDVKLMEQGTHASNAADQWLNLPTGFVASITSSSDDFTVTAVGGTVFDTDGSEQSTDASTITLESLCYTVTANDCNGQSSSKWLEYSQTSTSLLISAPDTNLVGASGTTITSEVQITSDYSACPVDIDDVQEAGEFAVALSFDVDGSGDECTTTDDCSDGEVCDNLKCTKCLSASGETAVDIDGNPITNCAAALVTETGVASIHIYSVPSGESVLDAGANTVYIQGALQTGAVGPMEVATATVVLKRFEKGFGGDGKGDQIGDDIILCTKADGGTLTDNPDAEFPAIVVGGQTFPLSTSVGNEFECKFKFEAIGQADQLNDVWEVEVTTVMTDTARRLRATKRLNLKATDPLSGAVGFSILSDTTVVSENEASSSAHSSQEQVVPHAELAEEVSKEAQPVHNEQDDHTVLIVLGVSVLGLLVLYVCWKYMDCGMNCRNTKQYKRVNGDEQTDGGKGFQPRFTNLRY